jgi:sarcosine oxidase subunit beta
MIAVLGGGIAGMSLALHLCRRGASDVHVFDPHPVGFGSTTRATGGFRTQFTTAMNIQLSLSSRPFFVEHALEINFKPVGYAYVARSEDQRMELDLRKEVQIGFGLPIERVPTTNLFPGFAFPEDSVSNFCPLDGTFDATKLLGLVTRLASEAGAYIHTGDPFSEPHEADSVVVACGAWSRAAGRKLGVEIDVTPEQRHVWMIETNFPLADIPVGIDMTGGWVFRECGGCLLAASPRIVGRAHDLIGPWLKKTLGTRTNATRIVNDWDGLYETTPDHHPFVGQSENPRIWMSCGFNGHGIMHSSAIADSLAAMMLGQSPPMNVTALSPLRSKPLHDPSQV